MGVIPESKEPITISGWYELTDGTYGKFGEVSKRGGPRLQARVATAAEATEVDRRIAEIGSAEDEAAYVRRYPDAPKVDRLPIE